MPPWFCAANLSMRGRRIDRIWDFGGSLPPVKPSTRMVAPGRRHRLEHPLHLVGIVGKRFDLFARQHRAERRAARVHRRALLVAADRHVLVELLELQGDRAPVVAGAHADVANDRGLETGELAPESCSGPVRGRRTRRRRNRTSGPRGGPTRAPGPGPRATTAALGRMAVVWSITVTSSRAAPRRVLRLRATTARARRGRRRPSDAKPASA